MDVCLIVSMGFPHICLLFGCHNISGGVRFLDSRAHLFVKVRVEHDIFPSTLHSRNSAVVIAHVHRHVKLLISFRLILNRKDRPQYSCHDP